MNKGRDPMLYHWEGSEGAVFSEGVDHTWKCEELLLFTDVSGRVEKECTCSCSVGRGDAIQSEVVEGVIGEF
jgi:hypothetical protein